jgi:hypothetical protein
MAHADTTATRAQTAIIAIAPVVLLAGFLLHPHIGAGTPDQTAIAAAAADHTTRWGIAHVVTGVGSGLVALAFLAVRGRLRDASADPWSARGVPLVVIGSTLYTFLPGMEFAPLAAARSGADVEAVAEAIITWFIPIHAIGTLAFGAGALVFARGILESGLVRPRRARLVAGALVVMAVARMVPLSLVQFYVQGAAAVIALWPLAFALRNSHGRRLTAAQPLATTG